MQLERFVSIASEGHVKLEGHGYEFADARVESVNALRFEADSGGFRSWRENHRFGTGVRVLRKGAWGFAAAEGSPAWGDLCRRAWEFAASPGASDESPPVLAASPPLNVVDPGDEVFSFPSEGDLRELLKQAQDVFPKARLNLRGQFYNGWRAVISSEGSRAIKPIRAGLLALSLNIATPNGVATLPLNAAGLGCRHVDVIRAQFDSVNAFAAQLATAQPSPDWRGHVVLSPQIAALLVHEAFGHACEADRLPKTGGRILRRGTKVGSPELSIIDCATPPHASGSESFDDEAVACREVPLVVSGRWEGMLHTRTTAGASKEEPTGSARVTGWSLQPIARMRVTTICPGSTHQDTLLSSVRDGIYLDRPYGGHVRGARFRIQAASAWRIRNGQLCEPFAGAALVGDPLRVLADIEAICSDVCLVDGVGWCRRGEQRDLPVSMAAPTISLREAEIEPAAR